MYYQQRIIEQLTQKYNRLSNAVIDTYKSEAKYLLDYLEKTPSIRCILRELELLVPEVNPEEWINSKFQGNEFSLPDTEEGCAKVSLQILRDCALKERGFVRYAFIFSSERNLNISLHEVSRLAIAPIIQYIINQLGSSSSVLYLLEKYKRRTEWFRKESLRTNALANSKQSEFVVDRDLREYLFDQGIDFPFSTPSSVSGRADIVADVGEEKLLVLEVKLFDLERGYDKGYIRKGFRQIFDYISDYNQPFGYLVVFNVSSP